MTFRGMTTRAKVQLGAIISAVLAMQVDAVKNAVTPLIANHPKLSSLATGLFTIVTLLQNPAIERLLGIQDERKTVEHPDGTTVTTEKTTVAVKEGNQ